MMSSCSLRLRMASSRSATAPRRSSNVVLPSFITFSTGKSLAVAQRSKCLNLPRMRIEHNRVKVGSATIYSVLVVSYDCLKKIIKLVVFLYSLVCISDKIHFCEQLSPGEKSHMQLAELHQYVICKHCSDMRRVHVWAICHCYAHVDRFPPKVKDLLSSNAGQQGLWYPSEVAVQACVIILGERRDGEYSPTQITNHFVTYNTMLIYTPSSGT